MGKIVSIGGGTSADLDPNLVLHEAIGEMEGVVLLGFNKDGEVYAASSYADGGTIVWLLEACKQMVMEGVVNE